MPDTSKEIGEIAHGAKDKVWTICRACHANCSLIAELEDGRPTKFYGDKDNPVSRGFSCIKGRNMLGYHELPSRLMRSVKRVGDHFEPLSAQKAVDEIAGKLQTIIADHGPRSVAIFCGTFGFLTTLSIHFQQFFLEAIGSKMHFTSATIDQPGKLIGGALHGIWEAGWRRDPKDLDVALVIGQNPIVSLGGSFGFSPASNIIDARHRGMKLIVCDPRKTETARRADIFLQPVPGNDAAILAAIIRLILEEELFDHEFVSENARGVKELRAAVSSFTPEFVAARAGIAASDMILAARTYAGGKRGLVICGTGPNMAPRGTLTEYLGRVLVTLCGHWPRAGEVVSNPGVLINPRTPPRAATAGPQEGWGFGEKLRVHNLTDTAAGLPTAALADEILASGEGKIRALIVVGGNPLLAFPDQEKTFRAMKDLDLLVCIDPKISATGKLADYVVAPTLPLEVAAVTSFNESVGTWGLVWGYDIPYAQHTPAILPEPQGSDLMDEWEFFFRVARAMGITLTMKPAAFANPVDAGLHAHPIDPGRDYTTEEILEMLFQGSPVPYTEIRKKGRKGHVFDVPTDHIRPKPDGWSGKFDLGNAVMLGELEEVASTQPNRNAEFPLLLISRRLRDHYNTNWHDLAPLKREHPYNPAFMNPNDMSALRLSDNDVVRVASDAGEILGIVRSAPELRSGCVSMSHGWGVNPDEAEDPAVHGGCTSRLISTDRDCDPYSWMARQSAIPVSVARFTVRKAGD